VRAPRAQEKPFYDAYVNAVLWENHDQRPVDVWKSAVIHFEGVELPPGVFFNADIEMDLRKWVSKCKKTVKDAKERAWKFNTC